MEGRVFASRILEKFDGDDYLMIEKLLALRSESLANQFKSDASAVLHSNNRHYATVSETITTNSQEVDAGTSVKIDADVSETITTNGQEVDAGTSVKIDADVLHSKNRQYVAASETITANNHEIVADTSSRKITIKIKLSDRSLRVVYGNSNETVTEEFNNPDIKNNETATEEFNNPDVKNNETSTEEFENPDVKNNKTTVEELNNPNTKKNNEMVDEESSFAESYKTNIKKIKANKKRSNKPSNKGKKKTNNNGNISPQPEIEEPGLPFEFKEKIEQMGGIEVKFVIQKELTNSDVTQNSGRLSIPKGSVKESFLTPDEESYLDYERNKKEKITGMCVSMLDHNLNLWDEMCLKKWKMETSEVYNITEGWNVLVAENDWKKDEKVLVQLWSFRRNHKLYFALVKL
ncbi:B3 domain-containing protein At2g24670-like [Lathyrus oleraceus]|uniref:B3 domain-containing protein At2g24670-like n=1 Tax=Pisum sativum TaxID=3888 RepID=UPI0021D02B7B|nr:B3 domain-containing protein At2g24670-like [Pisum sativum]